MKTCTKCGEAKPLDEFSRDQGRCRACRAEIARRYRNEHPREAREPGRSYRARHPERQRAAEYRWKAAHPELAQQLAHRRRKASRNAVFAHYGLACACCGSTERLNIDHVNGDGKQRRQEHGRGSAFYRWLVSRGFPEGFQTLCFPCNRSKANGERCRLDHVAVIPT